MTTRGDRDGASGTTEFDVAEGQLLTGTSTACA
jgi:hypothetical protein